MCLPDDCQPSASCNSGINLITELHYQIFYQNTGNVLTPQPKIVAVRKIWGDPVPVQVVSGNWKIRLSSSASFYDISTDPVDQFSKPPQINVEIPANLLYPFRKTT